MKNSCSKIWNFDIFCIYLHKSNVFVWLMGFSSSGLIFPHQPSFENRSQTKLIRLNRTNYGKLHQ